MDNMTFGYKVFRQLDFLSLFRLGKELGLVKRSRKMPIAYENDDTKSRTACRKLLRLIIKSQFDCSISSSWDRYIIQINYEKRRRMRKIVDYRRYLDGPEHESFFKDIDFLYAPNEHPSIGGGLERVGDNIRLEYNCLDVSFYSRNYRRTYNNHIPQEDFYSCSKSIQAYGPVWNRVMEQVDIVYDILMEIIRKRQESERKQLAADKAERDARRAARAAQRDSDREAESTNDQAQRLNAALEAQLRSREYQRQVAEQRQQRVDPQAAFNAALGNFLSRRDDNV